MTPVTWALFDFTLGVMFGVAATVFVRHRKRVDQGAELQRAYKTGYERGARDQFEHERDHERHWRIERTIAAADVGGRGYEHDVREYLRKRAN